MLVEHIPFLKGTGCIQDAQQSPWQVFIHLCLTDGKLGFRGVEGPAKTIQASDKAPLVVLHFLPVLKPPGSANSNKNQEPDSRISGPFKPPAH